jgi:hypothetical protein
VKPVIILLLLLVAQNRPAQNDVSGKSSNTSIDFSPIEVEVVLAEDLKKIKLPAYCGVFMQRMTLKYKVVKVLKGKYSRSTISINHVCPREAIEGKYIVNGKTYTYTLVHRDSIYAHDAKGVIVMRKTDPDDYEITKE